MTQFSSKGSEFDPQSDLGTDFYADRWEPLAKVRLW
jgi:hypothetical protein